MMSIGSFGDILFEVSADRVRTWDDARRQGKARYARHEILGRKPLLEYTGPDVETQSLVVALYASLGVNPADELRTFRNMRDDAEAQILVLGGHVQGYYVLEDLAETIKRTDARGLPTVAEAQLSLVEYIQDAESMDWRGYNSRGFDEFSVASLYTAAAGSSSISLGDFSLSSLLPGEVGGILKMPRIADILGRIPSLPELGGLTSAGKAVIGSVLSNLSVPTDFSARGMHTLISSAISGATKATMTQTKAFLSLGYTPDKLAEAIGTDGAATLAAVGRKVEGLASEKDKVAAVKALVGRESQSYMRTALQGFAARLAA